MGESGGWGVAVGRGSGVAVAEEESKEGVGAWGARVVRGGGVVPT